MNFSELSASIKLKNLAKHPIDLSAKNVFTPERIRDFCKQAVGFDFSFAGEQVTTEVMGVLQELAEEAGALSSMEAMQAGKPLNHSLSVLHTAMRDQFDHPQTAPQAKKASELAAQEIEKLETFLQKTKEFSSLVQIGIGGSELGPHALLIALEPYAIRGREVRFVANLDPDDLHVALDGLNLRETLFVIVSKSGETLETQVNETLIRAQLSRLGLDPRHHCIGVTGKGSPMDRPEDYLELFYLWDYVGGRYSSTSMVGGVALSFYLGLQNFLNLLKGAHVMDRHALTPDNLPLTAALLGIWNRNFLYIPTLAILPYSRALHRFPAHIQQLDMESNGKHVDREGTPVSFKTGPIVWGEPGTNAQHSFYQLLHQGTDPVAIEMIGFRQSQYGKDAIVEGTTSQEKLLSNLFAQSLGFAQGTKGKNSNQECQGNRPHHLLLADKLDPFTAGALLAYYEHKVAFQGFIWGINSFDQEGVQLGKRLANDLIGLFALRSGKALGAESPLGDAYLSCFM